MTPVGLGENTWANHSLAHSLMLLFLFCYRRCHCRMWERRSVFVRRSRCQSLAWWRTWAALFVLHARLMIHSARSGSIVGWFWCLCFTEKWREVLRILLICVFGGLKMFKLKACSSAWPTGISSALSIPQPIANLHPPQWVSNYYKDSKNHVTQLRYIVFTVLIRISAMMTSENLLGTALDELLTASLLFCRIPRRSSLQPAEVLSACVQT